MKDKKNVKKNAPLLGRRFGNFEVIGVHFNKDLIYCDIRYYIRENKKNE